jgi:hypothetical protein
MGIIFHIDGYSASFSGLLVKVVVFAGSSISQGSASFGGAHGESVKR